MNDVNKLTQEFFFSLIIFALSTGIPADFNSSTMLATLALLVEQSKVISEYLTVLYDIVPSEVDT